MHLEALQYSAILICALNESINSLTWILDSKVLILIDIMEKYTVPKLPTAHHILEDASDNGILNFTHSYQLPTDDEALHNAYCCFQNCKQLEADAVTQSGLNTKLQELNQKLLESIANMKAQIK